MEEKKIQPSDGGNHNSPECMSMYQPTIPCSDYPTSETSGQNNASFDFELLSNSFQSQYKIQQYRPKDPTPNQIQSLKQEKWKKQERKKRKKREKERKGLKRQERWKIQQPTDGGNHDSPECLSLYRPTIPCSDYPKSETSGQNNANFDFELLSNSFQSQCKIQQYRPKDPTPNQIQSLKQEKWKKQERKKRKKREKERKGLKRQERWKIQQPTDGGNHDSPEWMSLYRPTIPCSDYPKSTRNVDTETLNNFHKVTLNSFRTRVLYKEQINRLTHLSVKKMPRIKWLSIQHIKSDLEPGPYIIEQHGVTNTFTGHVIKHCSVLMVFKDHPWEYFDSRGIPLHKIPGILVDSNKTRVQHPEFKTCGLQVAYFLVKRNELGSMEEVKQTYPSQRVDPPCNSNKFLLLNDNFILVYLQKLYKSTINP